MKAKISDIVKILDDMAPPLIAEKWDNVGLLVGNHDNIVDKVMVCLDVTNDVIDEAIAKDANLIVAHHPVFFEPITNIRIDNIKGKMIQSLLKNDISVFCSHTNLDKTEYGTDHSLALRLGLLDISVLANNENDSDKYKITVFVPVGYEENVFKAMSEAGAGCIAGYSHCSFRSLGEGTFLPLEGAKPFIGDLGSLAIVSEYRLEMIVAKDKLDKVIAAMRSTHPYQEIAFDLNKLTERSFKNGFGRIGKLKNVVTLKEFLHHTVQVLNINNIDVCGDLSKPVGKVAVCAGSGASLACRALECGADVFVTGEIKHSEALDIKTKGLSFVLIGHYSSELPVVCMLTERLQKIARDLKYETEIFRSEMCSEPYNRMMFSDL